jgi:alpha/beta superfamily hydrolase
MTEKLFYIEDINSSGKVFIHWDIPSINSKKLFLFTNPIFDEKKRVQRFQAETARALCENNVNAVRFDYYGTGDSYGELYEFNFEIAYKNIDSICNYFRKEHNIEYFFLLGIRFGADLAIQYAQENNFITLLFIIEPIIYGQKYLREQRIRRKAFYILNKMTITNTEIQINNEIFEDHQGFLMSQEMINFLINWNLDKFTIKNNTIVIFDIIENKSKLLIDHLNKDNKILTYKLKGSDFWSILEPIDTMDLTENVVRAFEEVNFDHNSFVYD